MDTQAVAVIASSIVTAVATAVLAGFAYTQMRLLKEERAATKDAARRMAEHAAFQLLRIIEKRKLGNVSGWMLAMGGGWLLDEQVQTLAGDLLRHGSVAGGLHWDVARRTDVVLQEIGGLSDEYHRERGAVNELDSYLNPSAVNELLVEMVGNLSVLMSAEMQVERRRAIAAKERIAEKVVGVTSDEETGVVAPITVDSSTENGEAR